jgi:hypothetical protein
MWGADAHVTEPDTLKSLRQLVQTFYQTYFGGTIAVIDGQSLKHAIRRLTESAFLDVSQLLVDIKCRYPSWYVIVVDRDPISSESSGWTWVDNTLECGFLGSILVARLNRSVLHINGPSGERGILCFQKGNRQTASHQICRSDDLIMQFILTELVRHPGVEVIAVSDNSCYIPKSPPHKEWGAIDMDKIPPFDVEACIDYMHGDVLGPTRFRLPFTRDCVESSLGVIRGAGQTWRHIGAQAFAFGHGNLLSVPRAMDSPSEHWGTGGWDDPCFGYESIGSSESSVVVTKPLGGSKATKTKHPDLASTIAARQGIPLSDDKQQLLNDCRGASWYKEYKKRTNTNPENHLLGYRGDRPYPKLENFKDMLARWKERIEKANERARSQRELRDSYPDGAADGTEK